MIKILSRCLIASLLCLCNTNLFSQCPTNLDFEMGDFTNWECFIGDCKDTLGENIMNLKLSVPVPDRHEIISASSVGSSPNDPYGGFPKLCPYGGTYSVKLGNDSVHSQSEGLSYTFQVPLLVDTFTFTYFYAVVFQDPNHSTYEQPRFFVSAYDVLTGKVINCASYDYVSNASIPGFQQSPKGRDVLYKEWTPASLQFAGLQGRQVRLEFKTADCTLGGHFGYAYIDVGASCLNILANAPYCVETNSIILNAPYGFKDYIWYNSDYTQVVGNNRTVTLSPPPATFGTFHVDVNPYPGYGCRDTFQAYVMPLPVPDTPTAVDEYIYCQYDYATKLTATPTRGNSLIWYPPTSAGVGVDIAPIPSTMVAGDFIYYVSQKVLYGCESKLKKIIVHIIPSPKMSLQVNTRRQCFKNNLYKFTNLSSAYENAEFNWDLGDGKTINSKVDTNLAYQYTSSGSYQVYLTITNQGKCTSKTSVSVVVIDKPIADFSRPPIICAKQTNLVLLDKSSLTGPSTTLTSWEWNIDGKYFKGQNPTPFIPNNYGSINVKQWVKTAEGCVSDTNNVTIPVYQQPKSDFLFSIPLCNNIITNFKDQSLLMPSPYNEMIIKWNWQLGTTGVATTSNPSILLPYGNNKITLIPETNFGCKGTTKDSIIFVNPKPKIGLTVSDSCVDTWINFVAKDTLNITKNWFWNFGTGLYNDDPFISKTFNKKTVIDFVVMAQTSKGCKDTVVRKLSIYDNIATAGRDTVVADDQPIQLHANGYPGTSYQWQPAVGLNRTDTADPIATLHWEQLYKLRSITKEGCVRDSRITIKRYAGPDFYIPSAFTPNGDGMNDRLTVFPVGIKAFGKLSVYDRWGKLLYYTEDYTKGWDGTYRGSPVETGAYVAVASGVDYKGRTMEKKMTIVVVKP